MSQPSATTRTATTPAHQGVKQGLPAVGLKQAEQSAQKLWHVARLGTTANEAFAKELGMRGASGGSWRTRLALLNGFGLIKRDGERIGLSPVGTQLVNGSDAAKQLDARRTAFFNLKAYRELVDDFNGTSLPDKAQLASKLQFEYGKTADFAERAAQAFIDSLAHAELLDARNIVRKPGAPSSDEMAKSAGDVGGDEDREAAELDEAFAEADELDANQPHDATMDQALLRVAKNTNGAELSLAVTLDLSRYRVDEVIQILQALGLARG